MSSCRHLKLTLISKNKPRLKCRHCHLTIKAEDVENTYCPECYEAFGQKRYDFDPVEVAESNASQYRCEACGALIASK